MLRNHSPYFQEARVRAGGPELKGWFQPRAGFQVISAPWSGATEEILEPFLPHLRLVNAQLYLEKIGGDDCSCGWQGPCPVRGLYGTTHQWSRVSKAHGTLQTLDAAPSIHAGPRPSETPPPYPIVPSMGQGLGLGDTIENSAFYLLHWRVGRLGKARTLELDKCVAFKLKVTAWVYLLGET